MGGVVKPDGLGDEQDPLAKFDTEEEDPLAKFLYDKEGQLLPADSTAIVGENRPEPEKPAKRLYVGPAQTGNFVTKPARNIAAYGANRFADLGDAVIQAMTDNIPIFIEPGKTLQSLGTASQQLSSTVKTGFSNLGKAVEAGTATEYLKRDFVQQTIYQPLADMAERVVMTPIRQVILEPIYIARDGKQMTSDAVLKKQIEEVLPDYAMLVASSYFGRMIAEKQLLANVGKASGALAGELASNTANLTSVESLFQRIIALPIQEINALAKSMPINAAAGQLAARYVAEGAVGGVSYGLAMQGTPEEKINSMVQMGFFSIPFIAAAHGVMHVGGVIGEQIPGVRRFVGGPSKLELIQEAADRALVAVQLVDMWKLPHSERQLALAMFADRLDPAEIMARTVSRGIFTNITKEMRKTMGENGFTYFDRGDGKFNVLVDRTKYVDQKAYAEFPEGAEQRTAELEQAAREGVMENIRQTDPAGYAEIQELFSRGETEAAEAKIRLRDKRAYNKRAVNTNPEWGLANRRSLDFALAAAEADPNVTILTHDLGGMKAVGPESSRAFAEHVKQVLIANGVPLRDVFWYGGDQLVTFVTDNQNPALVQKIKTEIDAFRHAEAIDPAIAERFNSISEMQKNAVELRQGISQVPPGDPLRMQMIAEADRLDAASNQLANQLFDEGWRMDRNGNITKQDAYTVTPYTGSGSNLSLADADLNTVRTANGRTAATPFNQSDSFFTPEDQEIFRVTGYVPFEKVAYNGSHWYISEVVGKTVDLIDDQGHSTTAKLKDLRRLPEIEVARPNQPDVVQVLEQPINEANIPKEPGFRLVIDDSLGPIVRSTESSTTFMDETGLRDRIRNDRIIIHSLQNEFFGSTEAGAAYRQARNIVFDPNAEPSSPEYKSALDRIEKMEGELTAEQRKRLFEYDKEEAGYLTIAQLEEAALAARDFPSHELVISTVDELTDNLAKFITSRTRTSVYNRQVVQRILSELQSFERINQAGGDVRTMFEKIIEKVYKKDPALSKNAAEDLVADAISRHTESGYIRDLAGLPIQEIIEYAPTQIRRFSPEGIVANVADLTIQALNDLQEGTRRKITPKIFHYVRAYMDAWKEHADGGSLERMHREVLDELRRRGYDILDNEFGNHVDELFQLSEQVSPEYLQNAISDALLDQVGPQTRFRAEIHRNLADPDRININARAHEGQPHYEPDPDVINGQPLSVDRVRLDFESYFDKAVYMIIRSAEEIKDYTPERKLYVENRMRQLSNKVGIPVKELEAHKAKLMQEVAKAAADYDSELREIGMEPTVPGEMPQQQFIGIGAQTFDGATSNFYGVDWKKFGKTVDPKNIETLMSPEEVEMMKENRAAFDAMNRDLAIGRITELNDNGILLMMDGGSTIRAVDPSGNTIATFNTLEEALLYRQTGTNTANSGRPILQGDINNGSGDIQPPGDAGSSGDLGGGNLPPTAANFPDSYVDPYGGPNVVNMMFRLTNRITPPWLKPLLATMRDIGGQYGMDTLRVGAHHFDGAAMRAAAEIQYFGGRIDKMFKEALRYGANRIKLVIGSSFKVASIQELLSNIPGQRFNAARPTTPTVVAYFNKLAALAEKSIHMKETPVEALHRALGMVKNLNKIEKNFPDAASKQTEGYRRAMKAYQDLVPNKASQDMVNLIQEILGKDIKEADLFEIVGLTEAHLTKSLGKADFQVANKMTPKEVKIGDDMRLLINEVGALHSFDGVYLTRILDQISRIASGTFDESVYSYQKGWTPEQLSFLRQMVREPSNIGMHSDPFKLMQAASVTSVRSRVLIPARDAYLADVVKDLEAAQLRADIESMSKGDNNKAANKQAAINKKIMEKVTAYTDEVIGRADGYEYIINDAFNITLNFIARRLGSSKEFDVNVRRKVLNALNRLYEGSAQGGRPKAGAADTLFGIFQLYTTYRTGRFVKIALILDKAIRNADALQKRGDIPGINIVTPEELSGPASSSRVRRIGGQLALGASETLFDLSGQPLSFKMLTSIIHTEGIGIVAEAVKKYGIPRDQPTMLKLARHIDLDVLTPDLRKEFFRTLYYEGAERAAHFYGQAMQKHMLVQFGRGMHPQGWGGFFGRAFGTFGTWPLGAYDSFIQNLSNRSSRSMLGWATKVAGVYWLQHEIQKKTGLDLRGYSMYLTDWMTWRGSPTIGMGGAVVNWTQAKINGNKYKMRQYEWEIRNFMPNGSKKKMSWLSRLMPYQDSDPNWSSIVVPWSFGLQDAREATEELQRGRLMEAILREMSLRPMNARRGQ